MSWSTFATLLADRADGGSTTDEQLRTEAVGLGFSDTNGQIDDTLLNLCISEYCYLAGLRRLTDYDTAAAVTSAQAAVVAAENALADAKAMLTQARELDSRANKFQERLAQSFHYLPNRNVARDNLAPLSGSTRSLTGYSPTPPGDDTVTITEVDVILDSFEEWHSTDIGTFITAVASYASANGIGKAQAAKQLRDNGTASWVAANTEANIAAGRGDTFLVT